VQRSKVSHGIWDQSMLKTADKAAHETTPIPANCRAEFIFDAGSRTKNSKPIKVVGEYICDCRRPDWERRWNDWNERHNPYLNLFLCAEHAKNLGLLP
jgi:hypothetical protein